jgi:hypothetical protein
MGLENMTRIPRLLYLGKIQPKLPKKYNNISDKQNTYQADGV